MEITSSSETVHYIIIHIVQGFVLEDALTELDATQSRYTPEMTIWPVVYFFFFLQWAAN